MARQRCQREDLRPRDPSRRWTPRSIPPVTPLLRAVGVTKKFRRSARVEEGVSFDLCAGEVHGLVGENGAGKSTLIRVLTGAIRPDSGEIILDGKRIEHNDPLQARALWDCGHLPAACLISRTSAWPRIICDRQRLRPSPGGASRGRIGSAMLGSFSRPSARRFLRRRRSVR